MDRSVLEKSVLFSGVPAEELPGILETVPHHVRRFDRGETVFRLMEDAESLRVCEKVGTRTEPLEEEYSA